MTFDPAAFATGIGSPVTIDSSTLPLPSVSSPSTGTFSPGRTRSRSPTWMAVDLDGLVNAGGVDLTAVFGARPSSALMAPRGLLPRPQFQHLPEQHQHRDDGGGLEVDRHCAVLAAKRRREQARRERCATML